MNSPSSRVPPAASRLRRAWIVGACRHHAGDCRQGATCWFSHPAEHATLNGQLVHEDLPQPTSTTTSDDPEQPWRGAGRRPMHHPAGVCPRGADCWFSHVSREKTNATHEAGLVPATSAPTCARALVPITAWETRMPCPARLAVHGTMVGGLEKCRILNRCGGRACMRKKTRISCKLGYYGSCGGLEGGGFDLLGWHLVRDE